MDNRQFDDLVRRWERGAPRRKVIATLGTGTLAAVLGVTGRGEADAVCRKRREICTAKAQCCGKHVKCAQGHCDGGNTCCGGQGARCRDDDCNCCVGYFCTSGHCLAP